MNIGFGKYLKKYLETNNISQTEFAIRLNVSQKHMNELLNCKTAITLEMAANIERLTQIPIEFIINAENRKIITNELLEIYKSEEAVQKMLKSRFPLKELEDRGWICFQDFNNAIQNYIDIIGFLRVRNLEALENVQSKILFKKTGTNIDKLNLWIARCDILANEQKVQEYTKENFYFLIEDLKKLAYKKEYDLDELKKIFNMYGMYFVVEKALEGTKVRGCFKVKNRNPAIYITKNYTGKDSLFFEIFHELGHCKSDYNEAKNKDIIEGTDAQEKRADNFALNTMIPVDIWKKIEKDYTETSLLKISMENQIPISFIVGRLANMKMITYKSKIYNKYNQN